MSFTDDLDLGVSHFDPLRGGASVRVRWLGTAGFEITYETTTTLIDPYLTRASLPRRSCRPSWVAIKELEHFDF